MAMNNVNPYESQSPLQLETTNNALPVNFVHVAIIVAFCFAIRGFAHWVTKSSLF